VQLRRGPESNPGLPAAAPSHAGRCCKTPGSFISGEVGHLTIEEATSSWNGLLPEINPERSATRGKGLRAFLKGKDREFGKQSGTSRPVRFREVCRETDGSGGGSAAPELSPSVPVR
jgi:hypothetical protein